MMRFGLFVLSASCIATALAQAPAQSVPSPAAKATAAAARIATGSYSGAAKEENGSRTSEVRMTIRDVTADGRVTARVQASHPRAACAANLPANGLVLPDGEVRFEVNDGVPEGCERIYNVKFASGNSLSGTYIGGPAALPKATSAKR